MGALALGTALAAAAGVATGQFVIPSVTDTHRCAWDTLNEKIATVGGCAAPTLR